MPQLVVLARRPGPLQGKTRLRGRLGAESCGRLQARLLEHTLKVADGWATATGGTVRLQLAGAGPRSCGRPPWRHWQATPQGKGSLGLRLQRAVVMARRHGDGAVVLIGADLPDLAVEDLLNAGDLLQRRPLVLGPATDGGYWLLGLAASVPSTVVGGQLFGGIGWGGDQVLATTLARAQGLELAVGLLRRASDLDRPEDLQPWLA
ncbi:MAG: TIGR04282 family arsenosugar biosynthesis glycosyltransferase [Synechococcus sp. Tobar2m-G35]|jgi:rSAM/selenodomain-associated transferase 1|nr:TIGR04282 family arsenosugar biosynthesis glycosyltransferase [Synechococcus sp. Tobar2m-G35]